MLNLGTLGNNSSDARAVSDDGMLVVGLLWSSGDAVRAFRWTPTRGMEDLNTVYASLLSSGSVLMGAMGVSGDGRTIVGYGRNGATNRIEGFVLYTERGCVPMRGDVDRNGCVDDADLLQVLFAFGQTGAIPADLNCDGMVDDADLLVVLFNFSSGC